MIRKRRRFQDAKTVGSEAISSNDSQWHESHDHIKMRGFVIKFSRKLLFCAFVYGFFLCLFILIIII